MRRDPLVFDGEPTREYPCECGAKAVRALIVFDADAWGIEMMSAWYCEDHLDVLAADQEELDGAGVARFDVVRASLAPQFIEEMKAVLKGMSDEALRQVESGPANRAERRARASGRHRQR